MPRVSNPKGRSPESAPGSTLAAEIEALDAARSALAAGRSAEALELTDAHRRRFPSGQLASDVEALAIDALARAGRSSEATARAARFLSRCPQSPHAARIESIAAP
jgi:outer membrane protein assembly factor BamD (BamD/ComL family)